MLHPYRYSQRAKHLRRKTWVFPRDYRVNASPLQVLVPQELGDPTKETGFFRESACRNEVSWQKPGFWAPMVNPVTINLLPPPLFHWLWALVAVKETGFFGVCALSRSFLVKTRFMGPRRS
ncbi:hypothetical protein [Microcoleus sp. EPA2]|uniref:hypothetical protein n=1 Tax=Microcoleus sp. EPA2 TaxID=2841654 RepID=UPI00312B3A7B